jgi:hypothetical protein
MRAKLALIFALGLGGCDQPASKEQPPQPLPANSEFGRWTVVPASTVPDTSAGVKGTLAGSKIWPAWRLDTKTGDLEFCTYGVIENLLDSNKPPIETLTCSTPVKGNSSE